MAPTDWASLPSDLVRRVADVFLATSDVDYYMSLRAVCRNWRAATDDPRGPDPRFSPRGWVMVTSRTGHNCLFLHVNTGRLLSKDLPMLRNFAYDVAASTEDGHLVLQPVSTNSRICLLNPITGFLVRFPIREAQFHGGDNFILSIGRKMFGAGSSPMVLYSHFDSVSGGCIDPFWDVGFNRESLFKANLDLGKFAAMVPFKGRAYAVYKSGSVAVVEHNCRLDEEPVVTTVVTNEWNRMRGIFLVDNSGDLLLVRLMASGELLVFRVDIENKVLEQIKSIGNRAIFLGERRCISVDAYNLSAIECNCLYYNGGGFDSGIFVYHLKDGSHTELSETCTQSVNIEELMGKYRHKSLARVLVEYACYGIMT